MVTKEVRSDQCWTWLQNGDLKRETKSLVVAAQNQSIRTNLVKTKIDKSQGDSLCRVRRKVDKSIDHIVSGCSVCLSPSIMKASSVWNSWDCQETDK